MQYGSGISDSDGPRNKLLAALPRHSYLRLVPHLEPVCINPKQTLCEYGSPIRYVFFPENGLVSLNAILKNGGNIELATVGRCGFLGVPLALGGRTALFTAVVEISGEALRMRADDFLAEFKRGGPLHSSVLNYCRVLLLTISQYATCNYFHPLEQRLARLLLNIHDHVGHPEFPMTQTFVSRMLGAARSQVAITLGQFRTVGLIDNQRGGIKIVDRKGLERAACSCYWTLVKQREQARLGA